MSQQSNPATLREALRKVLTSFDTKIEQHLNKALDEGRVKPDFRTGAFYVMHELADLAASGTEAAPSEIRGKALECSLTVIREGVHLLRGFRAKDYPSTCQWRDAAKAFLDQIDKEMGAVAMNESAPQGLQKASPEGEGRETPEEYKFNCEWKLVPSNRPVDGVDPNDVTKEFVYELPGETRVNGNVGAWYQSAVYWKHRALRQSAAPSGGAALLELAAQHCPTTKSHAHETWLACTCGWQSGPGNGWVEMWGNHIRALAQESQTGAVTETK